MCIIIYKPENKSFPQESTLKTCFENNPDGAGFMFANGFRVFIRKGFMTWEAFKGALDKARRTYGDALPYVLHFRISTQAGIREDNTHPFALSANMKELRLLKTCTSIGIAHNGVISLTASYSKNITYSDTMQFITDYLSIIIDKMHFYEDSKTLLLIKRLIGSSRLAILDAEKHCTLIGDTWTEENGVFYSNTGYKARKVTAPALNYNNYYKYYGNWDEYEKYYNYATRKYVFPAGVCPLWDDGDGTYCEKCADRHKCKL